VRWRVRQDDRGARGGAYRSCRGQQGKNGPSGSYDLECLGDTKVSTAGGASPEGAKGTKVPPIERTRRRFSTKIGEGDEVVGGHSRGTVLVIRDGRTVAITHYVRDGSGGWLENGYDACSGF
jgi:hypothetical protein